MHTGAAFGTCRMSRNGRNVNLECTLREGKGSDSPMKPVPSERMTLSE
jgi:hypothetical protein